jgi:hypothetical protein
MGELVGVVVELFGAILGLIEDGIEKWTGKPPGCLGMLLALGLSGVICYFLVVSVLALAR